MSLRGPIQRMLKRVEGFSKTPTNTTGTTITIDGTVYPIADYVSSTSRQVTALLGDSFIKAVPVRWDSGTALPTKSSTVLFGGVQRRVDSVDDRAAVGGYIIINLVDT